MTFSFSLSQNKNTVGWRKNFSFTHVHKITNVPVLYIENTHNDFDMDHSFPCFYFTTKPLLPIQQNSVRMRGRDEREKLLLMSIKLPMYLFYTSNKFLLIFLCGLIPYTFLFSYCHKKYRIGEGKWGEEEGRRKLSLIHSCGKT